MEFLKDYGQLVATLMILVATIWYGLATSRMARVMTRELDLRTKPQLGWMPPVVEADEWRRLKICHEVINIGLSYITIDKANLHWWPFKDEMKRQVQNCDQVLPFFLAPEAKVTFVFEVGETALALIPRGAFKSAAGLITGEVIYEFHSLDETLSRTAATLPSLE